MGGLHYNENVNLRIVEVLREVSGWVSFKMKIPQTISFKPRPEYTNHQNLKCNDIVLF